MLITSLLPLLARYSLSLDLVTGPEGTVTLTVIPRKAEGAKHAPEANETRPIAITATAAEIDAELARGTDGALGQLFVARKALGDQLAEQRAAADAAKAATAAKPKASSGKVADKTAAPTPATEPAPGEPASLW